MRKWIDGKYITKCNGCKKIIHVKCWDTRKASRKKREIIRIHLSLDDGWMRLIGNRNQRIFTNNVIESGVHHFCRGKCISKFFENKLLESKVKKLKE